MCLEAKGACGRQPQSIPHQPLRKRRPASPRRFLWRLSSAALQSIFLCAGNYSAARRKWQWPCMPLTKPTITDAGRRRISPVWCILQMHVAGTQHTARTLINNKPPWYFTLYNPKAPCMPLNRNSKHFLLLRRHQQPAGAGGCIMGYFYWRCLYSNANIPA